MDSEKFEFVLLTDFGHRVEHFYGTRAEADKKFDYLSNIAKADGVFCIAYYCASVGGLVNAHSRT